MPRCSPEQDLADHRPVEIDDEKARPPLGRLGHLALKLVTRPGAAEVGVHLRRGQQLDERRTVPGLGLAEHEPLGPDRLRRPGDGRQVGHAGRLADGQFTAAILADLHGLQGKCLRIGAANEDVGPAPGVAAVRAVTFPRVGVGWSGRGPRSWPS